MEKRLIPFILLFIIIFSSITVFGERMFTDVPEGHWAYVYIEKVVELGLMDGYDDATFRPDETVDTIDALLYISRLTNVDKNEIDRESIKEKFFNEGEIRKATKLEVSKYIAMAMGFDEETQQTSQIFLYNDISEIPLNDRPYIKFLIDKGILDKKGDGNGNFNPNQEVTRAMLAKMLSQAYDIMDIRPIIEVEKIAKPEEVIEPEGVNLPEEVNLVEETEYREISGNIMMILKDLLIIDMGDKIDAYTITDDTQIIIDGESAYIESLEEEMDVKLLISQNKIIKKIEVGSDNIVHGIIDEIFLGEAPYLVVETKRGYTKTFNLSANTRVVLDGRDAYLFSLDEGDKVKVETFEDTALFITGESREGTVTGIIKGKSIDEGKSILVERDNGSIYEYKVNPETIISRDLSGVEVEDLRDSDEVIIHLKGGEVYKIDASSVPGEDRGYIRSILISDESLLTIEREDGTTASYYISDKAMIVKDNSILNIYDLRLGAIVDLELRSDEIVNLKIRIQK